MIKIVSAFLALALAVPVLAQEDEGAGEYASVVAPGRPLDVPPGIYAYSARELAAFYAETAGARTILAADLKRQLDEGKNLFVLDVRPKAQYDAGHIPGAVGIPLTELFKAENLAALPTDGTEIVVVCVTGHTASMTLGGLVALGYNPYVLRFGMTAWKAGTTSIVGLNGPIVK